MTGQLGFSGAGDLVTGNLGTRYSERPTISFSLLGGEAFQRRMLQPIELVALAVIAESGWRGERLLRMCVEEMNGLRNLPTASGPTPVVISDPRPFLEAVGLIQKLSDEQLVNFHFSSHREPISPVFALERVDGDHAVAAVTAGAEFESAPTGQGMVLVVEKRKLEMRFAPRSRASAEAARLREVLKLNPKRMRFELVALEDSDYDPFEPDKTMDEIALDTRSLIGVLYYLSHGIEAASEDVEAEVITSTVMGGGELFEWTELLDGLFRVESSDGVPERAAVAARHRGRWFYIDDSDQSSKSTFNLLSQLFTLQAGEVEAVKPVLTLPVGAP